MLRTGAAIAIGDAVAILVASWFVVPSRDETLERRRPMRDPTHDTRSDERSG